MISTSLPTSAHIGLHTEQLVHPCSSVPEVGSPGPQRARFCHFPEGTVRGTHIIPFCTTVTAPGLQLIARQVRKVSFDFDGVRPTHADLETVADALAAMTSLEELSLLGMPNRDTDGWVLRRATPKLRLFMTNISLTSMDVIDFLRSQPAITHLGTLTPPPIPTRNAYQHMPFPADVVPRLTTLDCSASFLISLQAASPPTRSLTNMSVDLNRLNPNVENEALKALAAFSSTVRRLSLRRSVLRHQPASRDQSGAMSMSTVLDRTSPNRRWPRLEFLEMHDGTYDASAIPGLSQSISKCFPAVETVVWAPSTHPPGNAVSAACIAIIFFTFCRRLRHFIFLDDAADPANKRYLSVTKQRGGELQAVPTGAAEVEDMWKQIPV